MDAVENMSLMPLITNASLPVQMVMGLLLLVSLMSWWYIFLKMFAIRQAISQSDVFEEAFWGHPDLARLYKDFLDERETAGSLERIFASGYSEFIKLKKKHDMDNAAVMDGARRAMRATYQREMDDLESHLSFLATIGSVSPYVGLLGTVWGIYHALLGMSGGGQVSIDQISGPVGEALVMTAVGLIVAIPAVLAYNILGRTIARIEADLEGFARDLRELLLTAPADGQRD